MNDKFGIDVTKTREDYIAYSAVAARRGKSTITILCLLLFFISVIIAYSVADLFSDKLEPHTLTLVFVSIFVVLYIILQRIFKDKIYGCFIADGQNFLEPKRVEINQDGISETSDKSYYFTNWRGVSHTQETKNFLLFYIDKMQAYIIPRHSFTCYEDFKNFYIKAVEYWKNANSSPK